MNKKQIITMLNKMADGREEVADGYRELISCKDGDYWAESLENQVDILRLAVKMINNGNSKDKELEEWKEFLQRDRSRSQNI